MNLQQLNPWNWFKHEDDTSSNNIPVKHRENDQSPTAPVTYPLLQLHQEIDQLFEDMLRGFGIHSRHVRRPANSANSGNKLFNALGFQAKVNVASDDKNYHISLEVPGLTENDVSLDLHQGTLTVRGERKEETETKDRHYYRVEQSYGSFQRVLTLPEDADQDNITATIKNGVLDISLPRKALPASETKRIPITNS